VRRCSPATSCPHAPVLRDRCPPSPCGRLSRPPTTPRTPSHPEAIDRRRACPRAPNDVAREGSLWMVPTFTSRPIDGGGAQLFPLQPWPRIRRRLSPWLRPERLDIRPGDDRRLSRRLIDCCPAQIHQVRAGISLEGVPPLVQIALHRSVCLPDPGRLAVPTRPVVVGAALTHACVSRLRLPPASPDCCDSPAVDPSSPLGHVAPRGAPSRRASTQGSAGRPDGGPGARIAAPRWP